MSIGLKMIRNEKGQMTYQIYERIRGKSVTDLLVKPLSVKQAKELGLLLIRNT